MSGASAKAAFLYEATERTAELRELLMQQGGDVSEGSTGERVAQLLERYEWQTAAAVDDIVRELRNLEGIETAALAEIKKLQQKVAWSVNAQEQIKAYARKAMETLGTRKLKGGLHAVWVQPNGGKLPLKLLVEDIEKELPNDYAKFEKKPDNQLIRELLESGDEAVKKFAEFAPRGESVRIA